MFNYMEILYYLMSFIVVVLLYKKILQWASEPDPYDEDPLETKEDFLKEMNCEPDGDKQVAIINEIENSYWNKQNER